ncbi:MAG: hypothetical protein WB679_13840 [Terracidiphilus sp.]
MALKYKSGQDIMRGDRVLYAGDPSVVEFVADPLVPNPSTRWYVEENGQGIMISEPRRHGSVFSSDPESDELEFVSRALWYRIRIDDPNLASLDGFVSLLRRVLKHVSASTAVVTDFEGVWHTNSSSPLVEGGPVTLPLDVLLKQLNDLTQIVWGRFFLFENAKEIDPLDPKQLEEDISASESTVCIADNSTYFVFTRSPSLVHELQADDWPVHVTEGNLPDLLSLPEEL